MLYAQIVPLGLNPYYPTGLIAANRHHKWRPICILKATYIDVNKRMKYWCHLCQRLTPVAECDVSLRDLWHHKYTFGNARN